MKSLLTSTIFGLTVGAVIGLASPAVAQDAANGERQFRLCVACHAIEEGKHKVGPSLAGIFGRQAGTIDGFTRYSPALKESGVTWGEEELDAYLANPRQYIKGNRMAFAGVRNDGHRADIIEYLKGL